MPVEFRVEQKQTRYSVTLEGGSMGSIDFLTEDWGETEERQK